MLFRICSVNIKSLFACVLPQSYTMTDEECPICLDKISLETKYVAKCKHVFHIHCLDKWCTNRLSCPMCRKKIKYGAASMADLEEMFQGRTFICFDGVMDGFHNVEFDGPNTINRKQWFIATEGYENFAPQEWAEYYEKLSPSSQTYKSYQRMQTGEAEIVLISNGGAPPKRLFTCRRCDGFITNKYNVLCKHYRYHFQLE